jgi:putative ABC transport system permease protein
VRELGAWFPVVMKRFNRMPIRIAHRVPLARRNLRADRRRLFAGVLAIGLALMLVLLIDGLWTGIQRQASLYPDHVGAQLFVTQPGVANFAGETSSLPLTTLETVRATPGVDWAAKARGQFMVFELHGQKVAAYVVGAEPGEPGGPWRLAAGRTVAASDEVVVDDALARRHGVSIGDELTVGGQRFHVVGRSAGTSAAMTGFIFVSHAATDALLQAPDTTSYILVGTADPASVQAALQAQGLSVFTSRELAANDRALTTGIFGAPIRLMTGVAFVAGTLVVALTTYAAVMERRREYGVLKALGASGRFLLGTVLRQAVALAALGLVTGGALFVLARALLDAVRPQFIVTVTTGGLLRALLTAFAMAVLAALLPARRLQALEPAIVYRGAP